MSISIAEKKQELRREMRAALKTLSEEQIAAGSRSIAIHLQSLPELNAKGITVAVFGGLRGEPDLRPLIGWLRERSSRAAMFAIEDGLLAAREVCDEGDWVRGQFGVWEPRPDAREIEIAELSVILAPGLAFGKDDGMRLGRGAGHYDRLFAFPGLTAKKIGVCFDMQLRDQVPGEPHDVRMDAVVTEGGASWQLAR